jgi:methyl-accepting chemotaxis protein
MTFLPGLRGMFTRRRPVVEIEVVGGQVGATATGRQRDEPVVEALPADPPRELTRPEPTPSRGSDEVIGLVRKIGDHLDKQAEHTQRLDSLIEQLPEAMEALPEINRQNSRLLDVLGDHLERSRSREDALQSTLGRMNEASNHQTEVLGLVRQQLDTSNRAAGQMTETLGSVRQTLTDLSDSTTQSVHMLSEMVQMSEQRSTDLTHLVARTQRWMLVAIACCGVVSVASLVVAIAVFLA